MGERRVQERLDSGGWLHWVTLPGWLVYVLGGLLVATALALPWVARWQGVLRFEVPPAETGPARALRPALIALPGDTFTMGDDLDGPAHSVQVSGFFICQTEVTQGQWKAVMGTEPSDCDYGCGDKFPVQSVSWFDAVEYLNMLTRRENQGRTDKLSQCYQIEGETVRWIDGCTGYRLPTEAEWEYAARAGTQTTYSFGDNDSKMGEYAWHSGNSNNKVHDVAGKKANPWGLHDVHGNVWEWVWDSYGDYDSADHTNPKGPKSGDRCVLRGGSFDYRALFLRSALRFRLVPSYRYWNLGFRCARGGAPALSP